MESSVLLTSLVVWHYTGSSSDERVWRDLVQGKAQQGLVEERDSL